MQKYYFPHIAPRLELYGSRVELIGSRMELTSTNLFQSVKFFSNSACGWTNVLVTVLVDKVAVGFDQLAVGLAQLALRMVLSVVVLQEAVKDGWL